MRTGLKIILIILTVMVGGAIIAVTKEATGHSSNSGGGPLGIVITIGMIAAIGAIWKYKPEEEKNKSDIEKRDNDNQQLDKS